MTIKPRTNGVRTVRQVYDGQVEARKVEHISGVFISSDGLKVIQNQF